MFMLWFNFLWCANRDTLAFNLGFILFFNLLHVLGFNLLSFVFLAFCYIWFEVFINYFLTSQTQRVFCPPSGRMCPPLPWEGLNISDKP